MPGLGRAFLNEIKRGYAQLKRGYAQLKREPLMARRLKPASGNTCSRVVHANLVYRVEETAIVIIAVAHQSREHGYWRVR